MICNEIQNEGKRYFIKVYGIVQGVGYRPYVYNQAGVFNIKGWVSNEGSALSMEIEGKKNGIKNFLVQVIKNPPYLVVIKKVKIVSKKYFGYKEFRIIPSSVNKTELKFIPTDVATCTKCLSEIFDPENKRYRYPFTNCTECGPRYSIIKTLPYDRKNTTMKEFKMCSDCQKEYENTTNRRFHAQPNCCSECGPKLKLVTSSGKSIVCDDPIKQTINLLKQGKIVAIKGLGGFHLACDPQNKEAINILRKRKNRPHKPFAIMAKNIKCAEKLCFISKVEEKILLSNKRPIVLLLKKDDNILPSIIAPNLKKLGIMLPYTPLHHLLFEGEIKFLIMTSGNVSNSPIEYENKNAIKNLSNIADYFLLHNRDIYTPIEDSVVKIVQGKEIVVRRARGYTPYAINMNVKNEILASGAEQKSSFCISQNGYGYMSQYLGDLKNLDSYVTYKKVIKHFENLLEVKPMILAHDLFSSLLSSKYIHNRIGKKVAIQHHHAHMVSCMVEHNLYCPVIGVVFDGTGLGTDRNIWGGEFFVGTRKNINRVGHFKYVTIQGGDQAIKQPWRIAVSYLSAIGYKEINKLIDIDNNNINMVVKAIKNNLNCFKTSSVGRLFDCVASLLNIRYEITYDAQAAIELENIIDNSVKESYKFFIEKSNGLYQIDYKSILYGVLNDIKNSIPSSIISTKFHNTIGNATVFLVQQLSKKFGIKTIVLSGGVFENNYLLLYLIRKLQQQNFNVYYNQQIPINDNGISVGQLAIADEMEEN